MTDTERAPRPPDIGRRTLTPFGYAVCVVVPILLAALGLTVLHFHYDKEQLVSGTRISILTSSWEPGADAMTDEFSGRLVRGDDGCLVVTGDGGTTTTLVWPKGYEATVQTVGRADQVKVYDTDRNIVARSEQVIEVGGGEADASDYAGQKCAPADGQVFLVQSKVKVIGQD